MTSFNLPSLFGAGLLTFVSPCVLPLVPIYLAVLGGASVSELREGRGRGRLLGSAVAFSLGLALVFVALGMAATAAGHALVEHRLLLMQLGGIAMLLMGLKFLGLVQVPLLDVEKRPLLEKVGQGGGVLGAFFLGAAFALGWTPCIGPVLGSVLTYTATSTSSLLQGATYLAAYAAGLVVPLVAVAVAAPLGLRLLDKAKRRLEWFEKATGALMVATGLLLVTDHLGSLGRIEVTATTTAQAAPKIEPVAPCDAPGSTATSCGVPGEGGAPATGEEAGAGAAELVVNAPTMVEFMSPSCTICQRMAPVVAAAGSTCAGQGVTPQSVDVSRPESAGLLNRYSIRGIPTFLFLDAQGREVARLVGEQPLALLDQSLAVLSGHRCEGFREIRAAR